jgi:hypothetical protein
MDDVSSVAFRHPFRPWKPSFGRMAESNSSGHGGKVLV